MGTKFLKEGEDFSFPESFGFKGSVNPRNHPTQNQDEMGDGTYLSQQAQEPTYARGGHVGMPHMRHSVPVHKAATAVLGALQVGKKIGQATAAAGAGMPAQDPTITQGPIPASMMMGQAPAPGGAPAMAHGGAVECRAEGGKVDTGIPTPRPDVYQRLSGPFDGDFDAKVANMSPEDRDTAIQWQRDVAADANAQADANDRKVQHHAKGGWIKGAIKHPGRETKRAKAAGRSVHDQMEHDSHSKDPSLRAAGNFGLRLTGGDLKPKKKD